MCGSGGSGSRHEIRAKNHLCFCVRVVVALSSRLCQQLKTPPSNALWRGESISGFLRQASSSSQPSWAGSQGSFGNGC